MSKILVIDDDKWFVTFLRRALAKHGYETECHTQIGGALELAEKTSPDVVFLDVNLPDGSGLDLLPMLSALECAPEVIIITGLPDDDGAKSALTHGAWDYICKSDPVERVFLAADRALRFRAEKLAAALQGGLRNSGIVGNSKAMSRCLADAARAARSQAPVLITGDTGTGKELLARAIHENSARKSGEFVIVDCAALPTHLVESLLFGHKKGAFTGATTDHTGLVRIADGGTLFLDEVGELPQEMQKRFLRVLQDRKYRPVGSGVEEKSDFRLIAATNRDLDADVKNGAFRSDLLHRMRSLWISAPPLCEREGDVRLLTDYFLDMRAGDRGGRLAAGPDFHETLASYDWPGNVRELFMALESALAASTGFSTIFSAHLPPQVRLGEGFSHSDETRSVKAFSDFTGKTLEEARIAALDSIERAYLEELRQKHAGDFTGACEASGLSQSRLYALLKKHGITLSLSKSS